MLHLESVKRWRSAYLRGIGVHVHYFKVHFSAVALRWKECSMNGALSVDERTVTKADRTGWCIALGSRGACACCSWLVSCLSINVHIVWILFQVGLRLCVLLSSFSLLCLSLIVSASYSVSVALQRCARVRLCTKRVCHASRALSWSALSVCHSASKRTNTSAVPQTVSSSLVLLSQSTRCLRGSLCPFVCRSSFRPRHPCIRCFLIMRRLGALFPGTRVQ